MRPPETRWARIGPKNPATLFHTPDAGICLSAFVVAHRGRTVLLGRPRGGPAWPQKGGYPEAQARELEEEGAWLLPATHLIIEESPDHAALRITRDFAGLPGIPRFVMVQSHLRPARLWNPKMEGEPLGHLLRVRPRDSGAPEADAMVGRVPIRRAGRVALFEGRPWASRHPRRGGLPSTSTVALVNSATCSKRRTLPNVFIGGARKRQSAHIV